MKTLNLTQNTPEWHAYRRNARNASDAPAMLGCSTYKTRSDLLRQRATGIEPEVTPEQQARFDEGHRIEALARPLAEAIIGEELFPVSGVSDDDYLSASLDGTTLLGDLLWEHKSLNNDLRAVLPSDGTIGDESVGAALPLMYRVQMCHQGMVAESEKTLFTASKWDSDGNLIEARHCWYRYERDLCEKVLAGWKQFDKDLAAFDPATDIVTPASKLEGTAPESLPALFAEVRGEVVRTNLPEFKKIALAAIHSVNRDLKTDEDFANADKAIKWCELVEQRTEESKRHALAQTASIEDLFRTMDEVNAAACNVRLELARLVKARKEAIKGEIVAEFIGKMNTHVAELEADLKGVKLLTARPDFGAAIKGKRSVKAMRDACDTALANSKIAASTDAQRIQRNNDVLDAASEHKFLFADRVALAQTKQTDDLRLLVDARISQHKADEAAAAEVKRKADEAAAAAAAAASEPAKPAEPVQQEAPPRRASFASRFAQTAQATAPASQSGVTAGGFLDSKGNAYATEMQALRAQEKIDFQAWYEQNTLHGNYAGSRVECDDMLDWLRSNAAAIREFIKNY